jgi:serine protease
MARLNKRGISNDKAEHRLRIAVKLKTGAGNGLKELASLDGLGKRGKTLRLLPLIESVEPNRLHELMDKARHNHPDAEIPDFFSWYQTISPAGVRPDDVAKALRRLESVETAYVMRPVPPPVNPANDPRNQNQGYLDAAPNGIAARYAWQFAGGDGAGIGFVDMEQGWNFNHQDLAAARISLMSGLNHYYREHGTSVLGEVLMVDNDIGGVGVAPAASGRVISQWRNAASYNTPDAIVSAASSMYAGDVLLLEAQDLDPAGVLPSFWPVEIADATYAAILLATGLDVVVIEAGGNGDHDLDAYRNSSGKKIFDRTSPFFRDSGAIMVGAAKSASPHKRRYPSNYGNRIDCFAWGENIDTTTTNAAGTTKTKYVTDFNGTSGASPIIAGAALIVQSMAQSALGHRFNPRDLRRILTTKGTPSDTPATDRIGVMPNLQGIITDNELG